MLQRFSNVGVAEPAKSPGWMHPYPWHLSWNLKALKKFIIAYSNENR